MVFSMLLQHFNNFCSVTRISIIINNLMMQQSLSMLSMFDCVCAVLFRFKLMIWRGIKNHFLFLFSLSHVNCYDLCQIVIAFLKFQPCFIKRSSHSLVSFVYIPKMLNDRIKTFFNSSLHRKPCIWTWWNTHKCIPTDTHTHTKKNDRKFYGYQLALFKSI